MPKRLLIAFAHPDDESFGLGGLITKYVHEGVEVYLICATDGDAGTVAPEHLNGHQSIRDLRLAELQCAAERLGLKQVFTLGYSDSGMMGSEANQNPGSLWYQYQTDPQNVADRVLDVFRQVQPHVVVTFNRFGGYGHPDHIAIQRATVDAFHRADERPQKLYFNGIPLLRARSRVWSALLKGKNPRRMGRNKDIDIVAILNNIEPTHTLVDVRPYLDAWDEANACHASQGGRRMRGFARLVRQWTRGRQPFTRVYPVPVVDRVDEYDLFDGVQVEEGQPAQ